MAQDGSRADREFVAEAEEILESLRSDLADLADARTAGAEVDPERVNRLFRGAHSLKGLAGLFGCDPVHALAHRLEDLLDAVRLGRAPLEPPVLEVAWRATERFARLLGGVGDEAALAAAAEPVPALLVAIEAASGRSPKGAEELLDGLDLDPSLLRALTEYEEHRLRENLRRGWNILLVEISLEILAFEQGLAELSAAIRESGELLSTLPSPGDGGESQIRFSLLVASEWRAGDLAARLDTPGARVSSLASPAPAARPRSPERRAAPTPAPPVVESLRSIGDTVRVDIRKLDELMNLVGELLIQRVRLGELADALAAGGGAAPVAGDLAKLHKGLDRQLRELQAAILDVRMVPLRQVFEKVSRVVRRLRAELDKDVRLELRGADTELDKLIVEALADPLMHVVRNALDHAFESPEERAAADKPSQGSLCIEAFQRGNHVVVRVRDDGRGIDAAALRERAEELGRIEPGERLGEREALELVFAPGVSTRHEVTETSGRGVGMDVVRTNLTRLGGVVEIESTLGRGTAISLTVPITLAIIQSLIVGVGSQRFAIPLAAVQETLPVDMARVQRSRNREILNLRGEPLPLRRLADELAVGEGGTAERPLAVVIGMGDSRSGLLVDRVDGQQDTVIKPIHGPVRRVPGIAGATDLGDRTPVLVLDVSALLAETGFREAP